jgi:hypothetical protein
MKFQIRFKDIDPDTGETSQDLLICVCEDETLAGWTKTSIERDWFSEDGPSDPNREFYIKRIGAREYSSPLIQELLDEVTPEETERASLQMELNLFAIWVLKHYSTNDDKGFCYVNSMGEYTPTPEVIEHYLREERI